MFDTMVPVNGGGGGVSVDDPNTWTAAQTLTTLKLLDLGGNHTITFASADEAADRTLTIPAMGGNQTIGLLGVANTWTANQTIQGNLLQSGGINADGAVVWGSGSPGGVFIGALRGDGTVEVVSGGRYRWSTNASNTGVGTYQTGFSSPAAGVVQVNDGTTGGAWMEAVQVADIGTPSTNCAGWGAEDVSGTAELIGVDEAGNETQLTPHAADGPAWLYDETPGVETVYRSLNRFTGRVEWRNQTREAKLLQKMVNGEKLTGLTKEQKTFHHVEDLDAYNARTSRNKTLLDWDECQAAKQAAYNAQREQEQAEVTKADAEHDAQLAAWNKADKAKRGERPAKRVVQVRPARDIRKPKPEWIK